MRIANKLSLLIAFFWAVLAINTFVAMREIHAIARELKEVAHNDIQLNEIVTSITQNQLEKTILVERILSISEEMGFENVPPARREHLVHYTQLIRDGVDDFTKKGALEILRGKEIIAQNMLKAKQPEIKVKWQQAKGRLEKIEQAHILYDSQVMEISQQIIDGKYELSLEDMRRIQNGHKRLSEQLKAFLAEVQGFVRDSMSRAALYENIAQRILGIALFVSIFFGILLALSIIYRISVPLGNLTQAANQIARGNYKISLKDTAHDETGEVTRAFQLMSQRILEATSELEKKNSALSTSLDITERQKRDLEKVNKELDRFAHTVSHDIRAPLTGIVGYVRYLEDHGLEVLDEKGRRSIQGIKRGANRLSSMIRDLLELTRISRIKNPYEEASVEEILKDVLERLEFKIKESRVEIICPVNLPRILCDRIKIGEVFLNLISNAVKFSAKAPGGKPLVEISYIEQKDAHEFCVKDNGIGIAPDYHDAIFEIFRRVETSQDYEGTGVGLSIVKSVIDDHGGKIWVESSPGQGAAFHFIIPKIMRAPTA
ncbi:MAG: HAMP domain-containing protein [Candidatus Omnitrophica bacterium]|nr:HAMP domain-containing protein [Candidatus Omnitrophota bacterium]